MSDAAKAGEDVASIAKRVTSQLEYFAARDARNIASTLSLVPAATPDALEDHVRTHAESLALHRLRAIEEVNAALAALEQGGDV
jgi:hypothetical protein